MSASSGHPQNQKFITHFEKLRQEAVRCNNMAIAKGLASVIVSVRKYPIPIVSASQAEMLHGVGPSHMGVFKRLFEEIGGRRTSMEWKEELKVRVEQFAIESGGFPVVPLGEDPVDESSSTTNVRKRCKQGEGRGYSPPIGTAAWGCLLVLHIEGDNGLSGAAVSMGISVETLKEKLHAMESKYPRFSKFNDSVVKRLLEARLIERRPLLGGKIFLSESGRELCSRLWSKSLRNEDLSVFCEDDNIRHPEQFHLVMIIDSREILLSGYLASSDSDVAVEDRTLPIGDVLWVWKQDNGIEEFVAGWVVERKTISDLSASIKDGRFEEQRTRLLKAPGVERIIYIIEGSYEETFVSNGGAGLLSFEAIRTAIRHTELMPNFSVIETESAEETCIILVEIYNNIIRKGVFSKSAEEAVTFRDFNSSSHKTKTLTVAQMSAAMLRSLPGVGNEASLYLHEYFCKIGKHGLSLGNLAEAIRSDPLLSETMKTELGLKRLPLLATGMTSLKEQYG